MSRLISQNYPVSRKEHECMACPFVNEVWQDIWDELTFSEKKACINAYREKKKVLPGQVYLRQAIVGADGFYTFKARIDIHDICIRLGLYPDE